MKLEAGKFYLTRDYRKAYVAAVGCPFDDDAESREYLQAVGYIGGDAAPMSWNLKGDGYPGGPDDDDLIAPYPDNSKESAEPGWRLMEVNETIQAGDKYLLRGFGNPIGGAYGVEAPYGCVTVGSRVGDHPQFVFVRRDLPDPGVGYRLLHKDEKIRVGDQFFSLLDKVWKDIEVTFKDNDVFEQQPEFTYRRPTPGAGEGYYLLGPAEVVREGDKFLLRGSESEIGRFGLKLGKDGYNSISTGTKVRQNPKYLFARKIEPDWQPTGKYFKEFAADGETKLEPIEEARLVLDGAYCYHLLG